MNQIQTYYKEHTHPYKAGQMAYYGYRERVVLNDLQAILPDFLTLESQAFHPSGLCNIVDLQTPFNGEEFLRECGLNHSDFIESERLVPLGSLYSFFYSTFNIKVGKALMKKMTERDQAVIVSRESNGQIVVELYDEQLQFVEDGNLINQLRKEINEAVVNACCEKGLDERRVEFIDYGNAAVCFLSRVKTSPDESWTDEGTSYFLSKQIEGKTGLQNKPVHEWKSMPRQIQDMNDIPPLDLNSGQVERAEIIIEEGLECMTKSERNSKWYRSKVILSNDIKSIPKQAVICEWTIKLEKSDNFEDFIDCVKKLSLLLSDVPENLPALPEESVVPGASCLIQFGLAAQWNRAEISEVTRKYWSTEAKLLFQKLLCKPGLMFRFNHYGSAMRLEVDILYEESNIAHTLVAAGYAVYSASGCSCIPVDRMTIWVFHRKRNSPKSEGYRSSTSEDIYGSLD
ncbi:hypothetical protein ASZ78_007765 [Callipepla squamata]|uniref:Tudor domain-containing protein n=1 Tax=Callipepla squamata TaxID=9009 RepID=A0A226N8I3_CALSU|nr:hypothetical protein ASZ78_007765 [Callipepla squamata]